MPFYCIFPVMLALIANRWSRLGSRRLSNILLKSWAYFKSKHYFLCITFCTWKSYPDALLLISLKPLNHNLFCVILSTMLYSLDNIHQLIYTCILLTNMDTYFLHIVTNEIHIFKGSGKTRDIMEFQGYLEVHLGPL